MRRTDSEITGDMKLSMLAMRIPISAMRPVKMRALTGSPCFVVTAKKFRKGMTPSAAKACKRRGAPDVQQAML